MRDDDLVPMAWLETDPVPLTPDVDFNDPEQRSAWYRANNEELLARHMDREAARGRAAGSAGEGTGGADGADRVSRGSTVVVGVRVLRAEQRALVREARRQSVTVSDLVRRWVREGLRVAAGLETSAAEPDEEQHSENQEIRAAVAEAADGAVERITDELRRLRELVGRAG